MSNRSKKEEALGQEIGQYFYAATVARTASPSHGLIKTDVVNVIFHSNELIIRTREPDEKGRGVQLQISIDYGILSKLVDIVTTSEPNGVP